jgi:hypothetical protein
MTLPKRWGYCDCCTTTYALRPGWWRLGDRCNDLSLSKDLTDPCPGIIRRQLRPDMPIAICRACRQVSTAAQVGMTHAWEETRRCPYCMTGLLDPTMGRFFRAPYTGAPGDTKGARP